MAAKFCLFITLCLLSFSFSNGTLQAVNGKIKLSIGTTSGCSDTVNFIQTQLLEANQTYGEFLEVEFVPWGRTVRGEDGLICQFGVRDCWANRLHRCALDMLRDDQDSQIRYMSCEFSGTYPGFLQGSYACAQQLGLNLVLVDYCMTTLGDSLEAAAEGATALPMEVLNFVPSLTFNDQPDLELHTQARTRLSSMICFALAEDATTGVTDCQI